MKTGGSTNNKKKAPKKTNKTENEIDLEKAKEISEGLMRRIIDMQLEAEQARINAMKDGAEKRRAQAELDYKRELEEIKRFGIDKKDEYVSQAAAEAKARGKKFDAKKFMESQRISIVGVSGRNISLDSVGDSIHTGMGNEFLGHSLGEVGVNDSYVGSNLEVGNRIFDTLCIVGDDGESGNFGSCTRG